MVVLIPFLSQEPFPCACTYSGFSQRLEDDDLLILQLDDHGDMIILAPSDDSLHPRGEPFAFEEKQVACLGHILELLQGHSLGTLWPLNHLPSFLMAAMMILN